MHDDSGGVGALQRQPTSHDMMRVAPVSAGSSRLDSCPGQQVASWRRLGLLGSNACWGLREGGDCWRKSIKSVGRRAGRG